MIKYGGGLNNRSQWGCHCLLFWCVHCDEAGNVPCSLTYRLPLIERSAAHLPCHPMHTTPFGKRKEWDKRELSHSATIWSQLKLDSDNIFWREADGKWTNWGKRLYYPTATGKKTREGDCSASGNERDRNAGGGKRVLITVMKRERGRERNRERGGEKTNLSHHS